MSFPDQDAILSTETAQFLTKNAGSATEVVQTLTDPDLYWALDKRLDAALLKSEHTFRVQSLEVYNASSSTVYSDHVKSHLTSNYSPHFLFHGTKELNHISIFENGFKLDDGHFGDTDRGYIGKGVYLSSYPEYAASYIKDTAGIRRFAYSNPVTAGTTCKLLGCIAIVGTTQRALKKEYACEIPSSLDSRWAWVSNEGDVLDISNANHFATEFAMRQGGSVYPHFRISLKRVTRHVVWFDPNIGNAENTKYKQQLKSKEGIYVFPTSDSAEALRALNRKKEGTEYRVITSGSGGEDLVRRLRGAGIQCKVLVFCTSVDYHKTWAKRFPNVEVTAATATMMNFATWK